MSQAVLSDAIYSARKRYTCDQCLRFINPGQRYRKQVHTYDGFVVYKAHEDCDTLATKLRDLAGDALNDDESILLHSDEIDVSDREWIAEEFPDVAERLFAKAAAAVGGK